MRVFCAGCGDQLRPVTTMAVKVGITRADYGYEDRRWRHTTKRYDNSYRPDVVTLADLFRNKARRHLGQPRWA